MTDSGAHGREGPYAGQRNLLLRKETVVESSRSNLYLREIGASMPNSVEESPLRSVHGRSNRGPSVMLIDPIPLFRDAVANLIAHRPGLHWLGSTRSVHAAVVMNERLRPDIVVTDSALDPRGQLCTLLHTTTPGLTVVALVREPNRTARYLSAALGAGVQGVLLRSAEPAQLLEALRRSYLEHHYIDPALSTLTKGIGTTRAAGARIPVSRREYEVLQLIADGLDNQRIAAALFVSVETVRTHVKSILRKLHARDRAHAIAIAFRLGLLVPQPDLPDETPQGSRRRATTA
ncbi:MAG: response regulator transcription factor [Sciscionella sp.]